MVIRFLIQTLFTNCNLISNIFEDTEILIFLLLLIKTVRYYFVFKFMQRLSIRNVFCKIIERFPWVHGWSNKCLKYKAKSVFFQKKNFFNIKIFKKLQIRTTAFINLKKKLCQNLLQFSLNVQGMLFAYHQSQVVQILKKEHTFNHQYVYILILS